MKIFYYSIETRVIIEGLTYNATRDFSHYDEYELPLIFTALTSRDTFYSTCVSFYNKNKNCIIRFYQELNGYHIFKFYNKHYPAISEQQLDELDYKQFSTMIQKYL